MLAMVFLYEKTLTIPIIPVSQAVCRMAFLQDACTVYDTDFDTPSSVKRYVASVPKLFKPA